jgi:hypothetical protein
MFFEMMMFFEMIGIANGNAVSTASADPVIREVIPSVTHSSQKLRSISPI